MLDRFRGIDHYNYSNLLENIEYSLRDWVSWSLLSVGGWINVNTGNTSYSVLSVLRDRAYANNTVFQAPRKDWVWETGVNYIDHTGGIANPLDVKIYVNNILQTGGYHVNYPNGTVIFNTPQANKKISAIYSYRAVGTAIYEGNFPWLEVDYNNFVDSGLVNVLTGVSPGQSLQMPVILIESIGHTSQQPFELGSLNNYQYQDVFLHCLSQSRFEMYGLMDIFRLQKDKTIVLYDKSKIDINNYWPLDCSGRKYIGGLQYPQIISNNDLIWRNSYITRVSLHEIKTNHPNFHWGRVKLTLETVL